MMPQVDPLSGMPVMVNKQIRTFSASSTIIRNTGGGGGVNSVTAGDGTITVGGTATDPTVAVNAIAESKVTNLVSDLAAKQATLSLTTTGTSGAATLIANTLNIPQYAGGSGITRSITNITTTTSAGSTASTDYVYNATSGTFTITLPTAVSNTNQYDIKNSGTGVVTIATTSAQTIDQYTDIQLIQYQALRLVSNGSNWIIIG